MASKDGQQGAPETAVRGQAPATLRHAAGAAFLPHGPVLLHGVSYELGERLHGVATGQAELFGLRERDDVVLKVYFGGRNPKSRPTTEMLERYRASRSPHLMRLLDFGYGADGLGGEHDWELLERLDEVRVPDDERERLAWIASSVVPAVRGAIDALLSRHLVHCDLKPENLMRRGSTGDLVLVDIGSLKEIDPQNRTSVTTVLSTTNAYAAPELLRQHVNDKTDAFALGMLLLKLVNPALLTPPADKEIVARITENKPVVDSIPLAPRLTDLINGLTRSAVSARWGVGELAIWCSGGTVSKVDLAPTLPPMRVQGRQITSVEELLSFMQDENAFWGVCEDEGDLPFTLRQWVNQLHDDEVGAALSRLVKRCLAEGMQEVGLIAVRRVLVPRAPLSVRGRQLAPTEDTLSDFIARTGEVTVDMEIALRVWSHRTSSVRAAHILELVSGFGNVRDTQTSSGKRKRFDLFSGIGTLPRDWAGARVRCSLLRDSEGSLPFAKLDGAADVVLSGVPVGSADGAWNGDLLPLAVLLPHASAAPTRWAAVDAAMQHRRAVYLSGSNAATEELRLDEAGIGAAPPSLLKRICGWPPGAAWLRRRLGIKGSSADSESTAEQVLWRTERRWLLAGELIIETPEALRVASLMEAVMGWFGGEAVRAVRIMSWFDFHEPTGLPAGAPVGPVERAHLLLWSAGGQSAWLGDELFQAECVVASLDERTLNRFAASQQQLVLLWLTRVIGEAEWGSQNTLGDFVGPRAYAAELCRLVRLVCVAENTVFIEDGMAGNFQIRVVRWNEVSQLSFRLVLAAFEQGCRTPNCDCGAAAGRCDCFLEMACSQERELAKSVVGDIQSVTADGPGGARAKVGSSPLVFGAVVQFSDSDPRTLEVAIRNIANDGWPEGAIGSDKLLTASALPLGSVPVGPDASSISQLWVPAGLILAVCPLLLAISSFDARSYFDYSGDYFDFVVLLAAVGCYAAVLKSIFHRIRTRRDDIWAAVIPGLMVLGPMAFFPFELSVLVSISASVLSIYAILSTLNGMRHSVSRYRWLIGLVSFSVVMLSAYQSSRLPLGINAQNAEQAASQVWVLTALTSWRWTSVVIAAAYLLAALIVDPEIRSRAAAADMRVRDVNRSNGVLAAMHEMLLKRVQNEK